MLHTSEDIIMVIEDTVHAGCCGHSIHFWTGLWVYLTSIKVLCEMSQQSLVSQCLACLRQIIFAVGVERAMHCGTNLANHFSISPFFCLEWASSCCFPLYHQ